LIQWTGIVVVGVGIGLALIVGTLYSTGSADLAVHDQQPITFSHQRHAGQLGVACQFCHRFASVSPVAGVPPVSICMTCHQSMPTQQPDLKRLTLYWNEQRPIPWIRLQRLPDHVYFTHEMHLFAGVTCQDCHGMVEKMMGTPRASTFEMGWCLTCHQQQHASTDCWTCHK